MNTNSQLASLLHAAYIFEQFSLEVEHSGLAYMVAQEDYWFTTDGNEYDINLVVDAGRVSLVSYPTTYNEETDTYSTVGGEPCVVWEAFK